MFFLHSCPLQHFCHLSVQFTPALFGPAGFIWWGRDFRWFYSMLCYFLGSEVLFACPRLLQVTCILVRNSNFTPQVCGECLLHSWVDSYTFYICPPEATDLDLNGFATQQHILQKCGRPKTSFQCLSDKVSFMFP